MRSPLPTMAALFALTCLLLALPGCGGGSSSTTSTSAASGAAPNGAAPNGEGAGGGASERSHRLPGHPKIASTPHRHRGAQGRAEVGARYGTLTRASAAAAERKARRRQRAVHRKLARKAGAAAAFLVSEGDNSVPTYGTEASAGELAAAEAALSRYLAARAAGEWGSACTQMSAQVQKQLALLAGETGAGNGCPQAYAKLGEKTPASARGNPLSGPLTALRVERPHAFALFVGSGGQQYMMPLEEEGGAWKVTQLEPLPWPIGSTGN